MKLLFTGDINFRGLAKPTPKTSTDIFAEVFPYFEKEDFRIVNLETPLANKDKSRITKQVFLCKNKSPRRSSRRGLFVQSFLAEAMPFPFLRSEGEI